MLAAKEAFNKTWVLKHPGEIFTGEVTIKQKQNENRTKTERKQNENRTKTEQKQNKNRTKTEHLAKNQNHKSGGIQSGKNTSPERNKTRRKHPKTLRTKKVRNGENRNLTKTTLSEPSCRRKKRQLNEHYTTSEEPMQ
jgi:hypothetical protein